MKIKKIFLLITLCSAHIYSQEQPAKKELSTMQSIGAGAIQGAGMMVAYTPFDYVGTRMIQGLVPVPWHAFRGVAGNVGAVAPITAIQVGGSAAAKNLLPRNENGEVNQWHEIAAIGAVGAASGVISNANEVTVLHIRNTGKGYKETIGSFPGGTRDLMRGASATAKREFFWSITYQKMLGIAKQKSRQYISNEKLAHGIAAVVTGAAVATATQPFQVAKSKMHADIERKTYYGTFDTLKKVYRAEGVRGLFRGGIPRAAGVAAALLIAGPALDLGKKIVT